VIVAFSCSCGDDSSKKENHDNAEDRRPVDRSLAELLGPDADGNGVRYDIDQYIEGELAGEALAQKAARQYAKALRDQLGAPDTEHHAVQSANRAFRGIDCMNFVLGRERNDVIGREIFARSFNTSERSRKHLRRGRHLGGRTLALTPNDRLAATCQFDTSGLEK
jgi:hypothetical protein